MPFGSQFHDPLYDRPIHNLYRTLFGYLPDVAERLKAHYVMKKIDLKIGEWVLDAGCGIGVYCFEMAHRGANVLGVDISSKSVRRGHYAAKKANLNNVAFIVADICHLPFKGNSFSTVICIDVLEHTDNDLISIVELHRALINRGKILIHVPHINRIPCLIKNSGFVTNIDHVREGYSLQSLQAPLASCDFEIILHKYTFKGFGNFAYEVGFKIGKLRFLLFPILYVIARLDAFSRRRGNELLVVAKKK